MLASNLYRDRLYNSKQRDTRQCVACVELSVAHDGDGGGDRKAQGRGKGGDGGEEVSNVTQLEVAEPILGSNRQGLTRVESLNEVLQEEISVFRV